MISRILYCHFRCGWQVGTCGVIFMPLCSIPTCLLKSCTTEKKKDTCYFMKIRPTRRISKIVELCNEKLCNRIKVIVLKLHVIKRFNSEKKDKNSELSTTKCEFATNVQVKVKNNITFSIITINVNHV